MFDVGFSELLLVFVIGLLILGPERLPRVAGQVGRWVGRARRMANQLRYQLEREIALDELTRAQRPKPPAKPEPSSEPESSSEPEPSSEAEPSSKAEPSSEPQSPSEPEPAALSEAATATSDAAAPPQSEGNLGPLGHAVEGTASPRESAPMPGTSGAEGDAAERLPEKAGSI